MKFRWGVLPLLSILFSSSLDIDKSRQEKIQTLSPVLKLHLSQPKRLLSTTYNSYDGMSGQLVGCKGIALKKYGTASLRTLLKRGVPLIATRRKKGETPCGSKLIIFNPRTKRFGIGIKLDTGPYSCYLKNNMIVDLFCPKPWKRKSSLDISQPLANHLGHSGLEYVYIWRVKEE